MLSLALGFLSSVVPKALELFSDARDKKHELDLLKLQYQYADRIAERQIEGTIYRAETDAFTAAINAQAKEQEGASQWVINVAALVRPIMAYAAISALIFGVGGVLVGNALAIQMMNLTLVMDFIYWVCGYYLGHRSIERSMRNLK